MVHVTLFDQSHVVLVWSRPLVRRYHGTISYSSFVLNHPHLSSYKSSVPVRNVLRGPGLRAAGSSVM